MTCGTAKTIAPNLPPNHAYAVLGYSRADDSLALASQRTAIAMLNLCMEGCSHGRLGAWISRLVG